MTSTDIIDSASFISKLVVNTDLVLTNKIDSIKKVKKELTLKESRMIRNVRSISNKRVFTGLNWSTYNTRADVNERNMKHTLSKVVQDAINRKKGPGG